jgi:hypothetical protein
MERGVGLAGRDLQLYRFVGLLVGIVSTALRSSMCPVPKLSGAALSLAAPMGKRTAAANGGGPRGSSH